MKTFKEYVENKNQDLTEAKLEQYSDTLSKMTADNDHMNSFALVAKILGDKKLIKVVDAINTIHEYENEMPIHEYKYEIQSKIMRMGKKKFGDDWDKYIQANL